MRYNTYALALAHIQSAQFTRIGAKGWMSTPDSTLMMNSGCAMTFYSLRTTVHPQRKCQGPRVVRCCIVHARQPCCPQCSTVGTGVCSLMSGTSLRNGRGSRLLSVQIKTSQVMFANSWAVMPSILDNAAPNSSETPPLALDMLMSAA